MKYIFSDERGRKNGRSIDELETDLLVLTKKFGLNTNLGPGPSLVDEARGGLVRKAMENECFDGTTGNYLLFSFAKEDNCPQKHIVLAGIGEIPGVDAVRILFETCLDLCTELGASRLTIPVYLRGIPAYRLAGRDLGIVMADLVRRRCGDYPSEIEFYTTARMRVSIEAGLAVDLTFRD